VNDELVFLDFKSWYAEQKDLLFEYLFSYYNSTLHLIDRLALSHASAYKRFYMVRCIFYENEKLFHIY
jgi:hypothetical protein